MFLVVALTSIAFTGVMAQSATSPCPDPDRAPTAATTEAAAHSVSCLLDAERARQHLARLRRSPQLTRAARLEANAEVSRGYFAHHSPTGDSLASRVRSSGYLTGTRDWAVGETLAWSRGGQSAPARILGAWLLSSVDRQRLDQPDMRDVGVAVVAGTPTDPTWGATYAVVLGMRGAPRPCAAHGPTCSRGQGGLDTTPPRPAAGAPTVNGAALAQRPEVATMLYQASLLWRAALPGCPAIRVDITRGDAPEFQSDRAWAWAEINGCTITINGANARAWPMTDATHEMWCDILAHEYGHLLGFGHAEDPADIMHPVVSLVDPMCLGWRVTLDVRAHGQGFAYSPARAR